MLLYGKLDNGTPILVPVDYEITLSLALDL